ncbi:MAG: DNRLRE domain-containing protein [Kouleothrix sp.]|nr:DNRLRE domain-containing protein [Kouleothrix sp.]
MTNDSTSGGVFNQISSTSWAESITWNSKPAIDGAQLASLGAVAINTAVEVDLTSAISGNGTYSFAITLPSSNGNTLGYASKEASTVANRPQLMVVTR